MPVCLEIFFIRLVESPARFSFLFSLRVAFLPTDKTFIPYFVNKYRAIVYSFICTRRILAIEYFFFL